MPFVLNKYNNNIEEIDKNSFSEAVNVFGLNPGNLASWNGMYMHEDRIYCVSGVSGKNEAYGMNLSGIYIATSDIPKLENVGTYNDKETENYKYNYSVVKGEVVEVDGNNDQYGGNDVLDEKEAHSGDDGMSVRCYLTDGYHR